MDILNKPVHHQEVLPSGAVLVRFKDFSDIFWYDEIKNNPLGISNRDPVNHYSSLSYRQERFNFTKYKQDILAKAQENLEMDEEFLELVYKAKALRSKKHINKFGGNLIIPAYAAQSEKVFFTRKPGEKSNTLSVAVQVGIFRGESYASSYVSSYEN